MDPHLSTAAVDRQVYQSIYDTLIRLDTDLSLKPGLAQSWEQTDPKTLVLKLRPGVKFHDGEPFTAASVKANFERMQNHPKSLRKGEIAEIASVEPVDDLTVKLNLKQPSSPLLTILTDRAGMMVSVKAAEAAGDDFARKPVGTGPFKFVEWLKDDRLVARKFDGYWGKAADGAQLPYLDEVVYRPIPDGGQRLTALKTNTVDIINFPNAKDIPGLRNSADPRLLEVPGLAYRYIQIQVEKPPLDNKALRQAIAFSLDREAINKAVFFDSGQPAQQGIPPSSWAFDSGFKPYTRDLAKAKAKVAESGVTSPRFTLLLANTPEEKQLGEVYKEQITEAGIEVDLELIEFGAQVERTLKGEYQASMSGWSGRADPDANTYGYFHTKGAQNRSRYKNPKVDELFDKARETYDQPERKRLYAEINKIITDDCPMIFVQHRAEVKALSSKLQGFPHVPDGMIRLHEVWLAK
ncbi:MAG: ABC transporter substrate-binding protein [Chloroflexota bacterium]